MAEARNHISFLLNDEWIVLDRVDPGSTLLDFLRLERRLCGTKEGCAEGDCGACTVLVGRLHQGSLLYETVNACIRFAGSLDACHVVTIEHLRKPDGPLHPVQQAMVDNHGSQCGFCTPGIVMSLYSLWMKNPAPSIVEIETALQGNLCRCTGYEPIIRAARSLSEGSFTDDDPLVAERERILKDLKGLQDGKRVEVEGANGLLILPASMDDLAEVRKAHPQSTLVAGATDVGLWVTKHHKDISPAIFLSHLSELRTIDVGEDGVTLGAGVSYTQMQETIRDCFPQLTEFWNRIGGEQVRNMGTVGGNVANGSPIGDTPPVLIALGATVTLRCGSERRTIKLEDFFIDYGKQDRMEGDFVESLFIPFTDQGDLFAAYKISKRRDEDISSVCGAFRIGIKEGVVHRCTIAFGGMAATPKRARNLEKALIGKSWSMQTVEEVALTLDEDYAPISDWRASAAYRSLVAKNLLRRFFLEFDPAGNARLSRETAA